MSIFKVFKTICIFALLATAACTTMVSSYDPAFDQSLNKLSEDTSVFLASAKSGGAEKDYSSKETVTYYASTYNVLDRLSQRAKLSRGGVACPTDASLDEFAKIETSTTKLPDDYLRFDCREFQLYAVRLYLDQLHYAHQSDGVLNKSEATALGGVLNASILGAIQTFLANKPTKA